MFKDRIVVRHIVIDKEPQILHEASVMLCRDLCGLYDEGIYHITGDFMLQGDIEILYIKGKYTRLLRILIWLLEH